MLPADLPTDLPSFQARFGTDEQCRDYLFEARWPDGFRRTGCGHADAYRHKKRLIDECVACGKQHSLLAGTIFEQTKTGLARRFLAVYLVTSSKRGISAMELQRQMGFGSYGTAWPEFAVVRKRVRIPASYQQLTHPHRLACAYKPAGQRLSRRRGSAWGGGSGASRGRRRARGRRSWPERWSGPRSCSGWP